MDDKLSSLQAYQAMFAFIQEFYYRGGEPGEIGLLLSMMQLLDDGKPADQAMWNDWIMAIKRVMGTEKLV